MCGIVGVASEYITEKDKTVFNELLMGNVLRGWNATGIFCIEKEYNKGPVIHHYKKALPSPWMVTSKVYQEVLKENNLRVLVGHSRARTVGENTDKNAHPFCFPNVIGVHNGTLRYPYKFHKEYDTDSEALYKNVNEIGITETIKDTKGAYSLVFFNRKDHSLNFLRNKERPMYIAGSKDGRAIYWASEPGLLSWVLQRNNVEIQGLVCLKDDLHISFPVLEIGFTQKMSAALLKQKEAVTVYDNSGGFFSAEEEAEIQALMSGRSVRALTRKRVTVSSVVNGSAKGTHARGLTTSAEGAKGWRGYRNQFIESKEFIGLMNDGCVYCERVSLPNAPKRWLNPTTYLCEECKDEDVFNFDNGFSVAMH